MSGTKDTNWKSYCGPEYDGRIIGPDNWQAPAVPADYDDLFKCSDVNVLNVVDLDIPDGSQEDAIDCVRGSLYTFSNCKVRGSVTVKGSINGWTLQDSLADGLLEFGQYDNYWFAGRPPTQEIKIKNCTSSSGGKITIRLWDASYPFVANTRHRIQRVPKFIWFPYFCFRKLQQAIFGT